MSSILPFFLLQVGFFHTRKKRRRDIVRTTLIELVLGKIQLPEGMLSITMEDVAAITNLSPIGIEVSTLEAYPTQIQHTYDWPNQTAYSKFLKRTRRRGQYTGNLFLFDFNLASIGFANASFAINLFRYKKVSSPLRITL